MTNIEYNKIISFVDDKGYRAKIEIELKNKDNKGLVLSMMGEYNRSYGQCLDDITPRTNTQKELINLWKEYHLNDMNAGTEKQENILKENLNRHNWDYNKCLDVLDGYGQDSKPLTALAKETINKDREIIKDTLNKLKEEKETIYKLYSKWDILIKESEKRLNDINKQTLMYDVLPNGEIYKYGSSWLYRDLPKDIINKIKDLVFKIEQEEKEY